MVPIATEERKYTRSISQLKSYTRCPQAFYLERYRRADIPRRPAPWSILGVAFHETVMDWERSGRTLSPEDTFSYNYDKIVSEEWEKQPDPDYWILPPRTKSVTTGIKNYRARGLEQLPVYIERCVNAPWEISHIEKEFEIDVWGVTVKGAVDRILYYPSTDEYMMEDIKTGNIKGEDDVRQLAFYAFVARELWDVPVNLGRYWFTKLDRGSAEKDLSKFDKNFWVSTFKDLDTAINAGLFLATPGDNCGICSVKPWCNVMGWLQIGDPLKGSE